jgi:PhzF family phenazine biosynthesis protein
MAARTVRVFHVDAFTQRCFTGNPAAVVLDAEQLVEAELLAIARELSHGDVAFVYPPDADDHDLRVRFFTPRGETGFVGHATVALHTARAAAGLSPAPRQKQQAGLYRIQIENSGSDARIRISQPAPLLRGPLDAQHVAAALTALSLDADDLDARCPITVAGAGSTRALIGIRSAGRLAALKPDFAALASLSPRAGVAGFLVFTLDSKIAGCLTEARMFCPTIGIDEDPVSGNAHGMMAALLWRQRLLSAGSHDAEPAFVGAQGHHMGRAGKVYISLSTAADEIRGVTIGGSAVIVFATTISL